MHRGRTTAVLIALTTLIITGCTGGAGDQPAEPEETEQEADPEEAAEPTEGEAEDVSIAYFSFAADNTYSQATMEGIQEAADELGGTVQSFDGGFEATTQVNTIQDALSGDFDAFIISANDGNAVVPMVEDAIAQGIVVIAHFTPIGPDLTTFEPQVDGITSTIGPPLVSNGEWFGQMIVDACADQDPCQAAFMPGLSTLPLDAVRVDAMSAVLDEHPSIELVAVVDGGYLADPAYEATQDVLSSYPEVDVIGTGGDQMTVGVELALEDANLLDQVAIFGNGASRPGVEAVREGRWFGTYVNVPLTEGRTAGEFAIRAVRGEDVPTTVSAEELSPIGAIATQETLADSDFEGQWAG